MNRHTRTALTAAGGAALALGLIAGAGVAAGAQDEPELRPVATAAESSDIETSDIESTETIELDEADLDEMDLEDLDLEEVTFLDGEYDEEAWAAYDQCFETAMADAGVDLDALDAAFENGEEPTEADFEALDAAFEAADAACEDTLPEEIKAEMAEWAAFDECIAGIEDPFADGSILWIPADDGDIAVEFGAEAGTVTIGGTAEAVEIVDADGVEVLDEAALEAMFAEADEAWSACDDLAPEGAFDDLDGMIEGDVIELDELEELPMD